MELEDQASSEAVIALHEAAQAHFSAVMPQAIRMEPGGGRGGEHGGKVSGAFHAHLTVAKKPKGDRRSFGGRGSSDGRGSGRGGARGVDGGYWDGQGAKGGPYERHASGGVRQQQEGHGHRKGEVCMMTVAVPAAESCPPSGAARPAPHSSLPSIIPVAAYQDLVVSGLASVPHPIEVFDLHLCAMQWPTNTPPSGSNSVRDYYHVVSTLHLDGLSVTAA